MILCGDSGKVLKKVKSNTIDLIVTDPSYGMGILGNDWDTLPSVETLHECLRVLKHGAFAFFMCSPRQDCAAQMILNLKEAGFIIGFSSMYWAYSSGFAKASSISTHIDKRNCKRELVKELGRNPTKSEFLNGWREYRKEMAPKTEEAKKFKGAYGGFQPKPSVEQILVVMKKMTEKTFADQAMLNGKGITWLKNCIIPCKTEEDLKSVQSEKESGSKGMEFYDKDGHDQFDRKDRSHIKGRIPGNLLVSDDILNDGKERKSGKMKGHTMRKNRSGYSGIMPEYTLNETIGDKGSFSRYFDLDYWFSEKIKELPEEVQRVFPFFLVPKPSNEEKHKGTKGFKKVISHNVLDDCEGNDGYVEQNYEHSSICACGEPKKVPNIIKGNYHPTVKPIQLGSYLIILGSRERDIILDPFCGSGSFLIAAKMLNRKYIGIDIKEEYCEIAAARLKQYFYQSKIKEFTMKENGFQMKSEVFE